MAVVLSLLVILPALAENTDGQVYQGRTLDDELIVGVFADAADAQGTAAGTAPTPFTIGSESDMLGLTLADADDADPQDTLFNGKLYVSNQDDAFSTVLVTHLVAESSPRKCASVQIRNANTGETITLQLVPTGLPGAAGTNARYYQNYFRVVDRDGENQVDKSNGELVCPDKDDPDTSVVEVDGEVPTDTSIATGDNPATPDVDEGASLARINASDGDRLTIRAGTHIQEIYVDGEDPTFSEITPGDGVRFDSASLRIQFEVRDDGSGLRHDGEDVVSADRDDVSHDAAKATNITPPVVDNDPRIGDDDGNTDTEPISALGGGSQDIDVTFYLPAQVTAVALKESTAATAATARKAADDATDAATTAGGLATEAAGVAGTAADTAQGAGTTDDATANAALFAAERALDAAEAALTAAASVLNDAASTSKVALLAASVAADDAANDADADPPSGARVAAAAAITAAAATDDTGARTALEDAAGELDDAADELDDAAAVLKTASDADVMQLETDAVRDEGLADTAAMDSDSNGTPIDDHGTSGVDAG